MDEPLALTIRARIGGGAHILTILASGSRYGMTNIMSRHVGAVSARARSRFGLRDGGRLTDCSGRRVAAFERARLHDS
jgi:hypothetical protein